MITCLTENCPGRVYECFKTKMCKACQRRFMQPPAPSIGLMGVRHATRSVRSHANAKLWS